MLRRELAKLKTGEDVIAFFAKNGSNTPVKFVYCKRSESGDPTKFRPYDLEVIPELMEMHRGTAPQTVQLAEHFTISATGVVHVRKGQPSEYMSLGDWMHQCLMYSVLTSMNFFKFYLHGKVFKRWREHTRYTTFCHHREKLSRRLFLAKPLFVQSLVQINSLLHEVECVEVMKIGPNVYHLQEFADVQEAVRSSTGTCATKEFEQRHDNIAAILDQLVQSVSRCAELTQQSEDKYGLRVKQKTKSMVQEKKEALETARRFKIATFDHSLLGSCIRLVDYMFQACLVKVVIQAAIDFYNRVNPVKQDSVIKMFSVSVAFGEANTVFDPGLHDFMQMLEVLWRGNTGVVNSVPSFRSVRQYEQYVNMQNHQSVESILLRD
eukprot:5660124-Amphidinium_carterae.1